MCVFKRAFLYLTRKKTRSVLLLLILFSMGLFMLAGLTIRASANHAALDLRKSISSGLEIKLNPVSGEEIYATSYNEAGELVRALKHPLITESVAEALTSVPGVCGYYSEMGAETLYTGLNVVPGMYAQKLQETDGSKTTDSQNAASNHAWSQSNDFRVVQESEYHPYFRNGALELVVGRHLHIEDAGKVLISDELAARCGLGIGDCISGQNFDFITGELYGETYRAEIVGIFQINFEQQRSEWIAEPQILANTVLAPFELRYWGQYQYNTFYGGEVLAREEDRLLGSITLFVEDPALLDGIEAQVLANEGVDWSYYTIQRYDADYKAAARPLLSMVLFATCMVAVMVAGALLILSLVLALWMRSRRQEIHILTFLGMRRRAILAQFLVEMGMVVAVAFCMSWLLAAPATRAIGDAMTKLTSPPETAAPFVTTYEETTGITSIHRAPVKQEALPYRISRGASIGTLLAMASVSLGTVAFAFWRMQDSALLSRKGADVHHWRFQGMGNKGAMRAHHRAILYVTRRAGKSALLLLVLFVIVGLFSFGASIHSASEHAAAQLRESLGGYFKIAPNYRRSEVVNQIDQELVNRIAGLDEIAAANAMDICYMDVQNLSLNPGKFAAEGDEKANMARILGNVNSGLHEYFSLEIFDLVEGAHVGASDAGKALISWELAQSNQLRVGDRFRICAPGTESDVSGETYELEIAGLFSERQQAPGASAQTPECDMPSNFIFVDLSTTQRIMRDMQPERKQAYSGGAAFFVKDPAALEGVVQALDGLLGADATKLTMNNAAYLSSMEPLNRLRSMSRMLLAVVAAVGAILLTLILTLWERDRMHETGILMSFGIPKRGIWWQRFVECMAIFLAALVLSAAVLLPVAARAGDWLYAQAAVRVEQPSEREAQEDVPAAESSSADRIERDVSFHMELSPAVFALSGLASIALSGISVSVAFWVSAHHRPKELLAIME